MSSPRDSVRRTSRALARPGLMAQSAWLSARHHRRNWWRLPIVAAPSARIVRDSGAELRLDGRLFLGYQAALPRDAYFGEVGTRGARIWLAGPQSVLICGDHVLLGDGVQVAVARNACLTLGAETFVNPNSRILCAERITIGRGCAISWDVQILDFDAHELGSAGAFPGQAAPVRLGDRVWLGARATVLKG